MPNSSTVNLSHQRRRARCTRRRQTTFIRTHSRHSQLRPSLLTSIQCIIQCHRLTEAHFDRHFGCRNIRQPRRNHRMQEHQSVHRWFRMRPTMNSPVHLQPRRLIRFQSHRSVHRHHRKRRHSKGTRRIPTVILNHFQLQSKTNQVQVRVALVMMWIGVQNRLTFHLPRFRCSTKFIKTLMMRKIHVCNSRFRMSGTCEFNLTKLDFKNKIKWDFHFARRMSRRRFIMKCSLLFFLLIYRTIF